MWLRDTGVLVKMKYDALKQAIPIPLPKVWKDKPLNLYQLGIIMIVFCVGTFSSILVFFFELRKTTPNKSGSNQSKSSKGNGNVGSRIEEEMVAGEFSEKGKEHIELVDIEEEVVSMPQEILF